METKVAPNADLAIIPGILDLQKVEKRTSVVNHSENPITLYAKQPVGTCEAYADNNNDTGFYKHEMYSPANDIPSRFGSETENFIQ